MEFIVNPARKRRVAGGGSVAFGGGFILAPGEEFEIVGGMVASDGHARFLIKHQGDHDTRTWDAASCLRSSEAVA